MKRVYTALCIAALLWFVMFSPWTASRVNFWYAMTFSALTLTTLSTCWCREWVRDIRLSPGNVVGGLGIALALWCVFWVGDKVSQLLFGFAREEVNLIYAMRGETSPTVIAVLLLLIIGPAEEIFWRGFVQRRMSVAWGGNIGFLAATLCYTLVHLPSLNFMLIVAAAVVGGCWGLLYRFSPRSLTALIISHAVWDACAFVLFPF